MKNIFLLFFSLVTTCLFSQVEFKTIEMSPFVSVNNSGNAVGLLKHYNFQDNTSTEETDPAVLEYSGISNNEIIAGKLYDGTSTIEHAGYKNLAGDWTIIEFPQDIVIDENTLLGVYGISQNGKYITGAMPASSTLFSFQMFRYNTEINELITIIEDGNDEEYSIGYAVNENGELAGHVDYFPTGTLREPSFVDQNLEVTTIPNSISLINSFNDLTSDGNYYVGTQNNKPIIYNKTTSQITEIELPGDFTDGAFTGISDNLIAVGYFEKETGGSPIREAFIYREDLFNGEPKLLIDFLSENGIELPSNYLGALGTGMSISKNSGYVAGFSNNFPIFLAKGWVIKLDIELSIQDHTLIETVLYPSPANNNLTLNIKNFNSNSAQVTFYDFTGKKVVSKKFENIQNKIMLDELLPNLQTGAYFIKIELDTVTITKKIVVKH